MSRTLRSLPVLAAALLCQNALAQAPSVYLTTLRVSPVVTAGGPTVTVGHVAQTRPLVSGDVRVWTGPVSPVWTRAPAADAKTGLDAASDALPTEVALRPPYPNPSAAIATLPFDLPSAGHVHLALYDVLGREVAVVVDASREAGRHNVSLDTARLAPGQYFLRLTSGDVAVVSRLTIVR